MLTANSGIRTIFIHYVDFYPVKNENRLITAAFFRSILRGIPDLTILKESFLVFSAFSFDCSFGLFVCVTCV